MMTAEKLPRDFCRLPKLGRRVRPQCGWIVIVGLLAIPPVWFSTAAAQDGVPTACTRSAQNLFSACRLDMQEEYNETIANCQHVNSRGDRRACWVDARGVLLEGREECSDQRQARWAACDALGELIYDVDPLTDPGISFIDPNEIPDTYAENPYLSLKAGHTHVISDEEETIIVHVTGESREILGVMCRVVVDVAVEIEETEEADEGGPEYLAVEVTDDWYAQDDAGNVYYCGELSRNFEDGLLTDLDGSFEAGKESAKSGLLLRALPAVGDVDRQEFALGEAEDIVEYRDLATAPTAEEGGDNEGFPCGSDGCVKTYDFTPLEPDSAEFKYYLPGIGFVLAVKLEDGQPVDEREELVCVGDSLDILADSSCGIEDSNKLLQQLCVLAPNAFCQ